MKSDAQDNDGDDAQLTRTIYRTAYGLTRSAATSIALFYDKKRRRYREKNPLLAPDS
jgi:hypothetical protein